MSAVHKLITDHLDIWTAADTEKKSGRGRASGNTNSVYGIKKLRELILELAVRGKLVPQDPNDEPASELLKRIQAEQAKLITEGQIKKSKVSLPVSDEEKSFELAPGWEWVRVGQVGHDWGQKVPDDDFTYIEVSAIDSRRGAISSPEQVKPVDAPSRARKIVKRGTIIYSTIRPYLLNIAVIEENFSPEPIASTAFAVVHPFCAMPPRYFLYFFRSPVFVRYVESVQMGIAYPAINDGQFFSGIIPLPPLAEQHRIVAKVDELMALCDQLEAQHNNAADAHEQLVSHLLSTLTQSQDAADFNANWERIATHFDTLFTTESSIDALKQTLLQLAVMGKLVPQDPNDEPASELLKRIQAEKAKLIAEGKIKKAKELSKVSEIEKQFDLPMLWSWMRLGSIADLTGGIAFQSNKFLESGNNQVIRIGNVRPGTLRLDQKSVFIDNETVTNFRASSLSAGDLIITMTGTVGKRDYVYSAIIHDEYLANKSLFLNQRLCSVRPFLISPLYLDLAMKDDRLLDAIFSSATGTANQANISMAALNSWTLPLPPIAEQHRIVSKFNELMILCDQLISNINIGNRLQLKLADTLVEHSIS